MMQFCVASIDLIFIIVHASRIRVNIRLMKISWMSDVDGDVSVFVGIRQ